MGRRSGFQKKIDTTRWLGISATSSAQSAGSVAIQLASATLTPDTIMRTRGNLVSYLDGSVAPGVGVIVSVGMIVVPEGTGTTVLVEPFGDPNADWFYYDEFRLGYEEPVTDVIDIPGVSSFRSVIDNKAMRRARPDTEVQFVVTNTTSLSAGTVHTMVNGRFLLGF